MCADENYMLSSRSGGLQEDPGEEANGNGDSARTLLAEWEALGLLLVTDDLQLDGNHFAF